MQQVTTENIIAYLDGKVTDDAKSAFEAHLAVCVECSRSKDQIQALETPAEKRTEV
jgi:anti-sigma factor RsiW